MNPKSALATIVLALVLIQDGFCQDTNAMFLPKDEMIPSWVIFRGGTNLSQWPGSVEYRQMMTNAIAAGECRPAEQDPEGHWGPIVKGVQLSVRAATNVFELGKLVNISVIVRNTTTNTISLALESYSSMDILFTDQSGKQISMQDRLTRINIQMGPLVLSGQHQKKYDYEVGWLLSHGGTYRIQAWRVIGDPPTDGHAWERIYSGEMTIRVVEPAKP